MSWSLFLDEPVDSQGESPYKVVAGLAIEDKNVWPLTMRLSDANLSYFGRQLRASNSSYVKAEELLSPDVFFYAENDLVISHAERIRLIYYALSEYDRRTNDQLIALSQAKLSYCRFILNLLRDYEVRAFAIMAPAQAEAIPPTNQLRRDYAFLLERFFYFVDDQAPPAIGFLILSDLNKYTVTANSIVDYFMKTTSGKARSKSIMPEPLFARSRLNIIFQATSLLAYTLNWNFRTSTMKAPIRPELADFGSTFRAMRYLHISNEGKKDWSFKFIPDLY